MKEHIQKALHAALSNFLALPFAAASTQEAPARGRHCYFGILPCG